MIDTFGHFLTQVARAEMPMTSQDARRQLRTAAGGSEAVLEDGGFAVPETFSRRLVERMYLTGALMSRAFEMPITRGNSVAYPVQDESSRVNGSRFGGAKSFWQNEADAAIATKPRFGRNQLTAKKLTALAYLTDELVQDAAALDVWSQSVFSKELVFRVEDSMVNGDGFGKPAGILSSNALIQVPAVSGQASGTVLGANLISIWQHCWSGSRHTAVWLCHPDVEAQCITATVSVGTGGSELPLYKATTDPENQPFNTILGRPVICPEYMPVPGTPGDIMLVCLDRYALAIREGDPQQAVSMHVKFLTDEFAFRVTLRVDGAPIDQNPLTPFTGTNTVSPFVCIAQR